MRRPPPQRADLLDRRGQVSAAWHRYFLSLERQARTGGGGTGTSAPPIVTTAPTPGLPNEQVLVPSTTIVWNTSVPGQVSAELALGAVAAEGYWTPITNGDPADPQLLFDSNADCIVGFVPTV